MGVLAAPTGFAHACQFSQLQTSFIESHDSFLQAAVSKKVGDMLCLMWNKNEVFNWSKMTLGLPQIKTIAKVSCGIDLNVFLLWFVGIAQLVTNEYMNNQQFHICKFMF